VVVAGLMNGTVVEDILLEAEYVSGTTSSLGGTATEKSVLFTFATNVFASSNVCVTIGSRAMVT
jgi:hypothetical protein